MMKQIKIFSMFLAFLISALCLAGIANAFTFQEIEVDGVDAAGTIYVERGETVDIRIELTSSSDEYNVRVKAEIGGYEYGDVDDKTDIFDMESDVVYVKNLRLDVPDDIDVEDDDDDDYTLRIKAYNDDGDLENKSFKLRIKESRHKLVIQDVILRPSVSVDSGRPLFITIRVENVGAKEEDDIKVTASIPELGISARDYIDELVPESAEGDDDESSASSDELYLRIPKDATTGDYDVKIEVEYNRGHDVVTATEKIYVEGIEAVEEAAKTIISVDEESKQIAQSAAATYKVMFANLGTIKTVYSVNVEGTETWADAKAEPKFVTVDADSTGEVLISLTANSDAEIGKHMFTLKALSGAAVIKEINLEADVVKGRVGLTGVRKGLEIGFAILVILLIIVALIVAFKKMGRSSEEEMPSEEAGTAEGQSYYYYPMQ